MSDGVLQAIVGGAFAVIVALIHILVVPKSANGTTNKGNAAVVKKWTFTRTSFFIWIVAPALGASIATAIFLAGFNGVRAVAGSGPVPLKAPVAINGMFYPSGFMGDIKQIELNTQWTENCHHGPACVRVRYDPGAMTFAGVFWQCPSNNWGDQPGRKIVGAKKLAFWARGQLGGELVTFRVGGIQGKKYQDSVDKFLEPNPTMLTAEWQPYYIDLDGADMSSVIGAFSWSLARDGNPHGATFYLDEMTFTP